MDNLFFPKSSFEKLIGLMGLFLLVSFMISNYSYVAHTRGYEQYWVTIKQNLSAFTNDEYALSVAGNNNSVISNIIANTTEQSRKIIYYIVFLISIWALMLLARTIKDDFTFIVLLLSIFIYNSYNFLSFNVVLLTNDFVGTFLVTPLILFSFKFLLDQRFVLSSMLAAAAFYLHPGVCLWYFIVVFSSAPFVLSNNFFSKNPPLTKIFETWKFYLIFFGIFFILTFPRIYETLLVSPLPSVIDPRIRLDIFKYAWAPQTSLWFYLTKGGGAFLSFVTLASNIIMFFLIRNHFKDSTDKKIRLIYFMYIGSLVFLILNEILIHVFDFHFSVIYGLSRVSGINFLVMALLLALMIRENAVGRKYAETAAWIIFFVNHTLIHFGVYSPALQVSILFVILIIRFTKISQKFDQHIEESFSRNKFLFMSLTQKVLLCFIVCIVLVTGLRAYNKYKHPEPPNYYRHAIEYINQHNTEKSLVLFPFHKIEDFMIFSHDPGFFNATYLLVFIDLYGAGGSVQEKAYHKFRTIEQELGLGDTISLLKIHVNRYYEKWDDAWANKVNALFIERWGKQYDIGYIIREKGLSQLPYRQVYENKEYRVYKRN